MHRINDWISSASANLGHGLLLMLSLKNSNLVKTYSLAPLYMLIEELSPLIHTAWV